MAGKAWIRDRGSCFRCLTLLVVIAAALAVPAAASAQVPMLSVSDDSVVEHTGAEVWFNVSRSPNTGPSTAQYSIAPGTASAGMDYGAPFDDDALPNDGQLTWPPPDGGADGLDSTIRVTVPVVNDSLFEADEDLFLNLGTVVGSLVNDGQGRAVIINDDPEPSSGTSPGTSVCSVFGGCFTVLPTIADILQRGSVSEIQKLMEDLLKDAAKTGNFDLAMYVAKQGLMRISLVLLKGLGKKSGAVTSAPTPLAEASAQVMPGPQTLNLTLSKKGRKKLRSVRKAKIEMSMSYTDRAGTTATDTVPITFKNKKKNKKK